MKIFRACGSALQIVLAVALIFVSIRARAQNAAQASKSSEAPSGNAENGKRLYTKDGCYECHGREGQGSSMTGPRLGPDPVPFEVFAPYVRKPMREMPPYTAKVVSDQELADIYTFLQSRPHPPVARSSPLLK
jgi:mono/diheme cytochrome c family protein